MEQQTYSMGSRHAANRVPCSPAEQAVLLEKGLAPPGKGVAVREGFLEEVASEP